MPSNKTWSDAPTDTTGLTLFNVANDLHIGSKYQDNPNALDELNALKNDGFTILNGDIVDLACCKKSDVNYLLKLVGSLLAKFGHRYVSGNHERVGVFINPYIHRFQDGRKVGFTHGDLIANFKKWSKYRLKGHGANWFKLRVVDLFDDLDHLKAMRPLPNGFLDRAVDYCETFGLDILVCGHFHPEAERRYHYKNKLIIVLPAHKINKLWL